MSVIHVSRISLHPTILQGIPSIVTSDNQPVSLSTCTNLEVGQILYMYIPSDR